MRWGYCLVLMFGSNIWNMIWIDGDYRWLWFINNRLIDVLRSVEHK